MTATELHGESDRAAADQAEGEGIDAEHLKEILGFISRAPKRRPVLAASVFVVIASLGLAVAATMPRMYNSQARLLAQRDFVMPSLSNPGRAVIPREADNPTHDVSVRIMRRDNLIALIKEDNVVEKWHTSRTAALRFKDSVFSFLSGPPRPEDELLGLAQTLEQRMLVYSDDSTVTISVDWNDPHIAYELVTLVQKNFVEARYDSDITKIQDTISVLEEHAKTELEQVDDALAAFQALRSGDAGTSPSSSPTIAVRSPTQRAPAAVAAASVRASSSVDPDLTKELEEKRRQIRALEDSRQRTLETLKQQLVQAQLTLTAMHPTVIALQEKIDSLSEPPPDLARLKGEERQLMNQIVEPSAGSAPSGPVIDSRPSATRQAESPPGQLDPSLAPAKSRLDSAIFRYQTLMANIDSAKIELDITRAAFRYRYSVITPAEVPRRPKKPIALLLGVASILGGLILAMLAAAGADWQKGRILETWQVRRRLKLAILGEFEPPL